MSQTSERALYEPDMLPAAGGWQDGVFYLPLRVYYEDTDLGGMVYHGRYVGFLERVRMESIRGTCLDVDTLLARDTANGGPLLYVVRALTLTYHRQARVNDILIGRTMATRVRAASIEARQWITTGGDLVLDARLTIAVISPNGRPRRWPEAARALWESWVQQGEAGGRGLP